MSIETTTSTSAPAPTREERVGALLLTHWTLAVCPHCHHEQPRAENCTAPCPGCGAPMRAFALYEATAAVTR